MPYIPALKKQAGQRCRSVQESEAMKTFQAGRNVVCPDVGTTFVCPACLKVHNDLIRHERHDCDHFNALFRLNYGYHLDFCRGPMAVPAVQGRTEAYRLSGELYRMMRDRYGLTPEVIMHQTDDWTPYTNMRNLPNRANQPDWENHSYDWQLQRLLATLPHTLKEPPRRYFDSSYGIALTSVVNSHGTESLNHNLHEAQEVEDMRVIARFMEANPRIVALIEADASEDRDAALDGLGNTTLPQGITWNTTRIARSLHPLPDGADGVWLPLARQEYQNGIGLHSVRTKRSLEYEASQPPAAAGQQAGPPSVHGNNPGAALGMPSPVFRNTPKDNSNKYVMPGTPGGL